MFNIAYLTADGIWNRFVSGEVFDVISEVLKLLASYGIRPRQDDGALVQLNLSCPVSIEDAIVIGLRYKKKDDSFTEDHFLCEKNATPNVAPQSSKEHHSRRWLEFKLQEYAGTHKQQPMLAQSDFSASKVTGVNTISVLK